jgi:spore coat protein U-like protein
MGWWPWTGVRRVPTAAVLAALFCCALAMGDTQWLGQPYSVVMTDHIRGLGQSSTGSTVLTLTHDSLCTLTVSTPQAGDEVLRQGGPGGATLDTAYMITDIAAGDADWVGSTAFLTRSYLIPGNGTVHPTLHVKGTAPTDRAPEAGTYTATIVLTVTF